MDGADAEERQCGSQVRAKAKKAMVHEAEMKKAVKMNPILKPASKECDFCKMKRTCYNDMTNPSVFVDGGHKEEWTRGGWCVRTHPSASGISARWPSWLESKNSFTH